MRRFDEDTDREVDLNAEPDLRVNCSICLELVEADGPRSMAKLQCGHEFHLDCIGSAFNAKGIMQCPNCRNIEKGQWLYAIGSANVASDISMDSWIAEQYPFFLVGSSKERPHSEPKSKPFGFRICPLRGLMETEDPSIGGDAFYGNQDGFGEQMPPSPGLAYFTNFRPHPSEHMDAPNFTPLDRQTHAFPSIDVNYPTWRHHLTPSNPTGSRMTESRPSVGTGSSAMVPHPFGRRSSNGFPAFLPAGRPYDPRAWFHYPPYLSSVPNYFHPWGRGVQFPALPPDPWVRHR